MVVLVVVGSSNVVIGRPARTNDGFDLVRSGARLIFVVMSRGRCSLALGCSFAPLLVALPCSSHRPGWYKEQIYYNTQTPLREYPPCQEALVHPG